MSSLRNRFALALVSQYDGSFEHPNLMFKLIGKKIISFTLEKLTYLVLYSLFFRFCSECKSKVLRAYSILVGDVDSTKEKGYCPALYEGLRCCPQERHIHMLCDTDFIAHLIARAEPELIGT